MSSPSHIQPIEGQAGLGSRVSDLYQDSQTAVHCDYANDRCAVNCTRQSRSFLGDFRFVRPDGSQVASKNVQCQGTLILTGIKPSDWNHIEAKDAVEALASKRFSAALRGSSHLQRPWPLTMASEELHNEDCPVVSSIYTLAQYQSAQEPIPAECSGCFPGAPHGALRQLDRGRVRLPTEVHVIQDVADLTEDSGNPEWTMRHAVRLTVPPQGQGSSSS